MVAWNKGLTKETDERVRRLSELRKNQIPPMLGKHQTEHQKQRQKEFRKDRTYEEIYGEEKSKTIKEHIKKKHYDFSGENNPMYGKKTVGMTGKRHTTKSKDVMSKKAIGIHCGSSNGMYGKERPVGAGIGRGCYYDSPLQGRIWLRSSYELFYARYLDSIHELWIYEMETFELQDEMTYTPDFFLPRLEKFIEVKGWMRPIYKDKIDKFKEEYPWDLEVLFEDDLIKLGVFDV